MFEIVAGKYRRDYHALEDSTQNLKLLKIKIHDAYHGYSGNYDADIAIITLDRSIQYQANISPICLDLNLKTISEKQPPQAGTMGVIAGYG
jgi:Trypsin